MYFSTPDCRISQPIRVLCIGFSVVVCITDFLATHKGELAAIEVKNLQAHECVEAVVPALFYDEKLKGLPVEGIRLIVCRSFRETLQKDEKRRLREIVQHLLTYPVDEPCCERLSDRAEAVFRVIPGDGTVMCQDFIGLDDLEREIDAYEGLLNKLKKTAVKALTQLHSSIATHAKARVVAMRWDIPFVSIPWPANLTNAVLKGRNHRTTQHRAHPGRGDGCAGQDLQTDALSMRSDW
jgi:hypothetical protein